MTIIDTNEQKVFHPSLDIKDGILVLGFRIKNEKEEETDLYIVKNVKDILATDETSFTCKGESYSIDKKKRTLPKLSQKWSAESVNTLMKEDGVPLIPVNGFELYKEIQNALKKYIELEKQEDYTILTAWIMGTYFFPIFSAYPYIHVKAPKGSGKSQCLSFLNQTAFNAVKARASLPALRDTVDSLRGTYLMDQADALHRNNMEDFLDVLTDSYKRAGGSVRKMIATKNGWVLEEFEAYGPKGFASINQLPEDLRDRCIVTPLIRSNKNYPAINEEDSSWKSFRDKLYTLLINKHIVVADTCTIVADEYKKSNEIYGRRLELWLPIEVILRSFGVDTKEIDEAKKRFLSHYEFATYQTSEIEGVVIKTIMEMMKGKSEIILRPKEIASEIDSDLFEEDDSFRFASVKQKSTIVGRAITKFNLASSKLSRDSYGERYIFSKEHIEKIYDGYFKQQSEENDTSTYTEESIPENKSLLDVSKGEF